MQLQSLLGLSLSSPRLCDTLTELGSGGERTSPEVHCYADSVYLNYEHGVSLVFAPAPGYTPKRGSSVAELDGEKLLLRSIDVYNGRRPYKPFKGYPVELAVPHVDGDVSATFALLPSTVGKDIVAALGEPSRNGGEAIGVWIEYTGVGVMFEFGGHTWGSGDEPWQVLTLFEPNRSAGRADP